MRAHNNNSFRKHRQDILTSLNWPNVQQLVEAASIKMVKRAISGKSSNGINRMFKIQNPRFPRGLPAYKVNHERTKKSKGSCFPSHAASSFNKLPPEFRLADITCLKFKNDLKKHIRTMNHLMKHQNRVHNINPIVEMQKMPKNAKKKKKK